MGVRIFIGPSLEFVERFSPPFGCNLALTADARVLFQPNRKGNHLCRWETSIYGGWRFSNVASEGSPVFLPVALWMYLMNLLVPRGKHFCRINHILVWFGRLYTGVKQCLYLSKKGAPETPLHMFYLSFSYGVGSTTEQKHESFRILHAVSLSGCTNL